MGYIGKKPAQVDVSLDSNSITAVEMAGNSVLASEIAANAIGSSELANNSIQALHVPNATALTLDGGLTIDNITIDGTEIDLSSGDLTVDVAGDIILDADGGDITFKDGGTSIASLKNSGGTFIIKSESSDADIYFNGNDGGSAITAMAIDMSEGGRVGIGTTTPAQKLHVSGGTSRLDGDIVTQPTQKIYLDGGLDTYISEVSANAINFFAAGAERMRLTTTGLGIGITSPSYPLVVSDGGGLGFEFSPDHAGGGYNMLQNYNRSGSAYVPIRYVASQHEFLNGGSEVARIDSSGNLGIGTASPNSKLEVLDTSGATITLNRNDTTIAVDDLYGGVDFWDADGGGTSAGVTSAIRSYGESAVGASSLRFYTSTSSGGNRQSLTEAMRVHYDGNVGIGTTSPSYPLHLQNNGDTTFAITASTTTVSAINFGDTDALHQGKIAYDNNGDYLYFSTNGFANERLRIDSSGKVGIGTTSPGRDMVLKSEGSTNGFRIESNDANLHFLGAGASSGTGADDGYYAQYSQGTVKTQIWANGVNYFNGGNVGIGTTSPNYPLHVAGSTIGLFNSGADAILYLGEGEGGGAYSKIYWKASDDTLRLGTQSGGDTVVINESGKVSIGTVPSTQVADLKVGNNLQLAGDKWALRGNNSNNDLAFEYISGQTAFSDDNVKMVLKGTDGRLGIGTVSPMCLLHVQQYGAPVNDLTMIRLTNGHGLAGSDLTTQDIHIDFEFKDSNSNVVPQARISAHVGDGGNADSVVKEGRGYLTFHCSNTGNDSGEEDPAEVMRLTHDGNVVIGATSSSYKLYVDGTIHNTSRVGFLGAPPASDIAVQTGTGTTGDYWRFGGHISNTTGYFINDANAGVQISYGGTSWTSHSDERIKENIVSLGTVLPDIDNLRCVKYNRKGMSDTKIGFIAQDWESKFPQVVDEDTGFVIESDGSIASAETSESTTSTKTMSYTETIPILLKAIQELKTDLNAAKARITTLEG